VIIGLIPFSARTPFSAPDLLDRHAGLCSVGIVAAQEVRDAKFMTVSDLLALALGHHQAGRLQEAEQLYRQLLAADPNHPEACHYLGVLTCQLGNHDLGAQCIAQALQQKPQWAEAHNNLGTALQTQGRLQEASDCYHRAIALSPSFAEAHYNLANVLQKEGNLEEAVACYRRALDLKPGNSDAYGNLGNALNDQGRLDEAIVCYRRAVELRPGHADYHNSLGLALQKQGKLEDAVACYRRTLELNPACLPTLNNLGLAFQEQSKPDYAIMCYRRALELDPVCIEAHNNMGLALQETGKNEEAASFFRRALELEPSNVKALSNLANALKKEGRLDEAIACYRRALQYEPQNPDVYTNLGLALRDQGQFDEADDCFRKAIEEKPDHAKARWSRSLLMLLQGDFEQGWLEHEWRWKNKELPTRKFSQALWDGGELTGKTILLHAEQGLGDAIQFVRFAPLAKQRGGTVILECPKSLCRLFANLPVDHLVPKGSSLSSFDVQAPLLSLPWIFKTTLETVPAEIPYLFAAPQLEEQWRARLQVLDGFKIGIVWQGNPTFPDDRRRSFRLVQFSRLAQMPGVRLISLQKGAGREELVGNGGPNWGDDHRAPVDLGEEVDTVHGAFMDTAAIMMNLDLVITSDTAIAHLAGALGVPVWVALPFVPDWRWLLDRSDSPWYPTMRLFRQQRPGDWEGVFEEIETALRTVL
jgi:tetratricopeptide (TPR) repeat protein